MPISLVLADDHPAILNGLEYVFSRETDMVVLASCTNGEDALQAVRRHRPDILILDIHMPVKNGLAVLRELRDESLPTQIVVLTAALDEDEVLDAVRLGVRGVVLKEMALQLLVQCVRTVHGGGEWLERRSVSRALEKMLLREAQAQEIAGLLTPRETEMVRLVAKGLRNKEIAAQLSITEATVKTHLHRIYEKVEVGSRTELILYAQKKGLL